MNQFNAPHVIRLTWNQHSLRPLALILVIGLMLVGCSSPDINEDVSTSSSPQSSNSPVKKDGNYITASPNPVPPGPEPQGKTTIAWSTKGLPAQEVHVYVVEGDGPESLFATAPEGSQEAPWIPAGRPIEFRLYSGSGSQRKLLDKVVVTRNH
jgi:hypothetical protein